MKLFLCGDVMLGRGIDQILRHPSDPKLFEPEVSSALEYVELAENKNGPLPKRVSDEYVWGDALTRLRDERPDARIINLETSVTISDGAEPKGINYRMRPDNVGVLTAADVDCCVLSNNHVLDWGVEGLLETLEALGHTRIHVAGAGRSRADAEAPAILDLDQHGRVLVLGLGARDSGIPRDWSAQPNAPGLNLLQDFSENEAARIGEIIKGSKQPGDIAVVSIHWGGNWGYEIPNEHRFFAHALIDRAAVDVIHGHSSHHPKAIEIYGNKPIFYGCGDFLNDYEGIGGYEEFRTDLVGMYFVTIDARSGEFEDLAIIPMQIRGFRLREPSTADAEWFTATLKRESQRLSPSAFSSQHGKRLRTN